jgi:hypothetical protein
VQFPVFDRVQKIIGVITLSSALSFVGIGFLSPDHTTPQQAIAVKINGVVRYMTPTQKYIFDASLALFFLGCFAAASVAWYKRDMSD